MYNIYYWVLSFVVVSATYYLKNYMQIKEKESIQIPNSKTKFSSLKKKFNIKSSELSKFNKNIETDKKTISKTISKIISKTIKSTSKKNIDIISLPIDITDSKLLINNVPDFLLNDIKNKINLHDNDLLKKIVLSFINCKSYYKKIFESDGVNIISNMGKIENFSNIYKNELNLNNKYNNFEIVLKLFNYKDPDLYIKMKKNKLIKISKTDNYSKLDLVLNNSKIFLIENKQNYYIGYGNHFSLEIKPEQIKKIFFNNLDLSDTKINKNFELFSKYKIITFLYWTETKI